MNVWYANKNGNAKEECLGLDQAMNLHVCITREPVFEENIQAFPHDFIISLFFCIRWTCRVPFQTKAALKSLNNAHGDDFDLSQLVTSVNDTDSAQLLAMGLTVDQQAWAKRYHQLLQPMSDGAVLALKECRRRFEDQRWNCPIDKPAFFEKIFKTGRLTVDTVIMTHV